MDDANGVNGGIQNSPKFDIQMRIHEAVDHDSKEILNKVERIQSINHKVKISK